MQIHPPFSHACRCVLWDRPGSQLRNDLEIDKSVRGKRKLIHLSTTNDSLAAIGLSSDAKQNWISQTVSSLDRQCGLTINKHTPFFCV